MRIIVTGDRNWHAPELAEQVLNRLLARYGPTFVIVHGAATGIDRSFAEACEDLGIEQEAHPARWEALDEPGAVIRQDKHGRSWPSHSSFAKGRPKRLILCFGGLFPKHRMSL